MEANQIPRCKTCKFWTNRTNYEHGDFNEGTCSKMRDDGMVYVELHTGWDGGYVERIDTDEKFGCVLHEVRE